MTWGAVAIAGATVVGGVMSANAAGKAADQQSQSSQQAIMAQQAAIDQMRRDLSPWTTAGAGAQSALNQYLGIGGVGSSGVTSMGLSTGLSPDQVRQQLLGRYTTTSTNGGPSVAPPKDGTDLYNQLTQAAQTYHSAQTPNLQPGMGPGYWMPGAGPNGAQGGSADDPMHWVSGSQQPTTNSTVDEEGLNAAIAKYYEEANAQNAAAQADPRYGSLLQAFHGGQEFSFTGKDLASDPGYKFGLDQGTQGIERGQASRGNFLSGGAMKELARYNEDYAGTKFTDAFSRASSTWNTNLGAYNQNRNTIYDFLTGVSRTGQNSAAQVGTANNRAADSAGNYLTNAGTAQSAATIAGGNALTSGINAGVNAYNTSGNNLNSAAGWNTMLSNQGGGYSGYTGYVGGADPIANLNTTKGWTG